MQAATAKHDTEHQDNVDVHIFSDIQTTVQIRNSFQRQGDTHTSYRHIEEECWYELVLSGHAQLGFSVLEMERELGAVTQWVVEVLAAAASRQADAGRRSGGLQ